MKIAQLVLALSLALAMALPLAAQATWGASAASTVTQGVRTPLYFSCASCKRQYDKCKRSANKGSGSSRDRDLARCDKRYQACLADCK